MNREFIFDDAGNAIGYRCTVSDWHKGKPQPCYRLFDSVRGLVQHWMRAHQIYAQGSLFMTKEDYNRTKERK